MCVMRVSLQKADLPDDILFEKAGPRENVFFDPKETTAAIVGCGGGFVRG